MSLQRTTLTLLGLLFALGLCAPVSAGGEISFEREHQRIMDIENQVMAQPAYRESKGLIDEIEQSREFLAFVEARYAEAAATGRPEPNYMQVSTMLQSRLNRLEHRLAEVTKTVRDFREAIEGPAGGMIFPNSAHRTAVFTYDDPQGTGLGNAIALLLSKKMLLSSPVHSVAVANFRDEQLGTPLVTAGAGNGATYFDKVDLVTKNQNFGLAVWGTIARTGDVIRIDSFLQVPAGAGGDKFRGSVRIPKAMGGGSLNARLRSDRVSIETMFLDSDSAEELKKIARQVGSLRRQPKESAPIIAKLEGSYRIVGYNGTWAEILLSDGRRGWTSVDQFCTDVCAFLLKTANFTNDILASAYGGHPRRLAEGLTRDADEMLQQITALRALQDSPEAAAVIAETWIKGSKTPSPTFESLLVLAKFASALKREVGKGQSFDEVRLQPPVLQPLVDSLVEASIANPSDTDILSNLARLFDYAGDPRRAELARQIAIRVSTAAP
jgi:hypothetical protein